MRIKILYYAVCFWASLAFSGTEVEIVLQNGFNGYTGCQDTRLDMKKPTANFHQSGSLSLNNVIRKNGCGGCSKKDTALSHVILQFNLSSIPNGAVIKSAILSLYASKCGCGCGNCNSGCNGGCKVKNGPKDLHTITTPWSGPTATWNTPWTKAGGDYDATVLAQSNETKINVWENFEVTTAIAEQLTNPQAAHGFLLRFPTQGFNVSFLSSEAKIDSLCPKLTITYETEISGPTNLSGNFFGKHGFNRVVTFDQGKLSYSLPTRSSIAIYDLHGTLVATFIAEPAKQYYPLPGTIVSGLYLVGVKNPMMSFSNIIRITK